MSSIQIKKTNKSATTNKIIVALSVKDLSKTHLTKEQLSFVNQQIKLEKKSITINTYDGFIFIYLIENKKTHFLTLEQCRLAGNGFLSTINSQKISKIQVEDVSKKSLETLALVEGLALGNYQFIKYRANASKEKNSLEAIEVLSDGISKKELEYLSIQVEAVYLTRDLVNEPLSFLTAEQLGREIQKMGKDAGFKTEVFNKAKIESLKMGGLLAVNKGSIDPPVFIVMEHKPKGAINKKPYVFVGKGVVYDTGGLSLKPAEGMMTMKCDMGGAAAVAGALYSISKAELPIWVIGLVPATDNRPDGNAVVPGDVITISDGTTVEVLNTDAEGRLILSDALVYAQKYEPLFVVDLATLTGAAARAIGRYGTVALGTAIDDFTNLKQSGEQVHERLVEFPLWDDYLELLKSDIADIKNIGGATAGANTAAKFLERFTNYPWVHLDIAGPAFLEAPDAYRGKGGTGIGVRMLFDFIRTKAEV
jgi:leucyl aminopeptidase